MKNTQQKEIKITCQGEFSLALSELIPIQDELKYLTGKKQKKLEKSILKYGFSFPFFVWKNWAGVPYSLKSRCKYMLIDGHQRKKTLQAMKKRGIAIPDQYPCILIDAKDIDDARQKVLIQNSAYGKMTEESFIKYTKNIKGFKLNSDAYEVLTLPGIDLTVVNNLVEKEVKIDNKEEPEKFTNQAFKDVIKMEVSPGDLFQLGDHKLLCGDCLDRNNIKKLFGNEKITLLFTSPPYNDIYTYEDGLREGKEKINLSVEYLSDFIPVFADMTKLMLVNLGLSFKNFELNCYWDTYIKKAQNAGLKLLSWIIWDKINGTIGMTHSKIFPVYHEWIFAFGKEFFEINKTVRKLDKNIHIKTQRRNAKRKQWGLTKTVKNSDESMIYKKLSSVIRMLGNQGDESRYNHPATFPVKLPETYTLACSNLGNIICDPFGGSGSTLIACEQTGRSCRMYELLPKYCQYIIYRWEKLTGRKAKKIS